MNQSNRSFMLNKTNMTNTPRTDANVFRAAITTRGGPLDVVTAEFARELEKDIEMCKCPVAYMDESGSIVVIGEEAMKTISYIHDDSRAIPDSWTPLFSRNSNT